MTLSAPSKTVLVTAFLALAVALVACGDDNLSPIEFREQAQAICVQGDIEIGEAVGAVFGGDDVGPEQLQDALDTIVSVSQRQLDDIAALKAPSGMRSDVDAFIAEGRSANDVASAQGLGFFEIDDDPWEQTAVLAGGLGLAACTG